MVRWVVYVAAMFVTLLAFDFAPDEGVWRPLVRGVALGTFGFISMRLGALEAE